MEQNNNSGINTILLVLVLVVVVGVAVWFVRDSFGGEANSGVDFEVNIPTGNEGQ